MPINYNHKANLHTIAGPQVALPFILGSRPPHSVLDVGCGVGTWLKAFAESGVQDYVGIDGVDISVGDLLIDKNRFEALDLSKAWNLGRKFDLVVSLEVAEHLPPDSSRSFIKALCEHSDHVIFSGACPNQPGQNHINCQWPDFWQELFNQNGFACEDNIRPYIWNEKRIEVWYRQNMFSARRSDQAGQELRVKGMVHPEYMGTIINWEVNAAADKLAGERMMEGSLPFSLYANATVHALLLKMKRRFNKRQ